MAHNVDDPAGSLLDLVLCDKSGPDRLQSSANVQACW